jgi:hypothetical protein
MTRKICASIISVLFTVLPCFLVGSLVGAFLIKSFWYWAIGITLLAIPCCLLNRVHVRLYHGYLVGGSLLSLVTYGYTSTDHYPKYQFCLTRWGWFYWY